MAESENLSGWLEGGKKVASKHSRRSWFKKKERLKRSSFRKSERLERKRSWNERG
jgi:hypothetical protein